MKLIFVSNKIYYHSLISYNYFLFWTYLEKIVRVGGIMNEFIWSLTFSLTKLAFNDQIIC